MKIGILGLAGSGKDTFANMLLQHLDGFEIDRYAAPIKELTSKVFKLTLDEIEDRVIKETAVPIRPSTVVMHTYNTLTNILGFDEGQIAHASVLMGKHFAGRTTMSPREFMQLVGTEVVRGVRPTAWVDRLQNRTENLIVPDVRFENELCAYNILLLNGSVEVARPEHPSEHYAWDLEYSDLALPKGLGMINNDREITSLEDLDYMSVQFAEHIKTLL